MPVVLLDIMQPRFMLNLPILLYHIHMLNAIYLADSISIVNDCKQPCQYNYMTCALNTHLQHPVSPHFPPTTLRSKSYTFRLQFPYSHTAERNIH